MKLEGAIFDLDGTLIDSMPWWETIWDVVSAAHFQGKPCRPAREVEERMHTLFVEESVWLLCDYYARELGVEIRFDDLLFTINNDIDDFYRTRVGLKAGVRELLQALHERNIPMCVASASERESILVVLRGCEIEHYFSSIFTCSEVGKSKTSPDIYLAALNGLGTPIETTWVFEDAFTALNTASNAGLHTVGIYESQESRYEEMKRKADVYVDRGETVAKLIPMLE